MVRGPREPRSHEKSSNITQQLPQQWAWIHCYQLIFLPLIDKHNKARQNALALEKHWLTKNPWTRILTTFLGMAMVDLQRRRQCQWYVPRKSQLFGLWVRMWVWPTQRTGDKRTWGWQQTCFICCWYTSKQQNTQWWCRECNMPLYQVDRKNPQISCH